jgi:fructan beta-fructosidase
MGQIYAYFGSDMLTFGKSLLCGSFLLCTFFGRAQTYHEPYRPGLHFSPREKWMNDPNGLVQFDGVYHLFFQYYPGDIVWGPMHWGHATSHDLIHWQQQPIALYPDSLGYIFSGSAVVDSTNTSGFGSGKTIPLVAIFTQHDTAGERRHANDYQNESIAYSLDKGLTWTKYAGNPVLRNPGITDFRDPNVSWYAKGKKWVMALATKDRITFYSSPDLKTWTRESDFGADRGAHGGVWECPDLFPWTRKENGFDKTYWVLLVSSNPGGPNGGSGTQYFIGQFDGHVFKAQDTVTRWIDYGPDDYAGVTWNNTGRRRLFLGWMSNWDYANAVPTTVWRNAMTVPRILFLENAGPSIFLASRPAQELYSLARRKLELRHIAVDSTASLTGLLKDTAGRWVLDVRGSADQDFDFVFSDAAGEKVTFGYNTGKQEFWLDRSASGRVDFHPGFGGTYTAPRLSGAEDIDLEFVMDRSSLEVFADGGLTVMTAVFFPQQPMTRVRVNTTDHWVIKRLSYTELKSIW